MNIEIYGANWCAPCQTLKKSLNSRGIPFTYYDVDDSINLRKLSEITDARSIPVVVVDGGVCGANELQKLLDGKK